VTVQAKIYFKSLENNVFTLTVNLEKEIGQMFAPLEELAGVGLMVLSEGSILDLKKKFCDYGITQDSKLLLFPIEKSAKPEGVRWFNRFPKHDLVEYIYTSTSDQAICFVANDDVQIVGWGAYIHQYDYVTWIQITSNWKIYDSSNSTLVAEGSIPMV